MDNKQYPSKEEIYNMYITQNHSSDEVSKYFNFSKSTFFKIIKKYNIKKDKKLILQLRINTVLNKYGVENVSQNNDIKKSKEKTCLSHYGVKNPNQAKEVREKTRQTNLVRYGSTTPAGNKGIVEKMKTTCKQKYGVDNPSLVEEFKNKRRETNLVNFGVECNLSSQEQQKQIKDTCLQKYGVPYYCMTPECRNRSHGSYSKNNERIALLLKQRKIKFQREFALGKYVYDFKIGNILLEINPTYTHSVDIAYHNKCAKLTYDYHYLKSSIASNNGYLCIQIFDWINTELILDNIVNNSYLKASMHKREIQKHFVNLYTKEHLMGTDSSEEEELLNMGFVRVYDDGYDIF